MINDEERKSCTENETKAKIKKPRETLTWLQKSPQQQILSSPCGKRNPNGQSGPGNLFMVVLPLISYLFQNKSLNNWLIPDDHLDGISRGFLDQKFMHLNKIFDIAFQRK